MFPGGTLYLHIIVSGVNETVDSIARQITFRSEKTE